MPTPISNVSGAKTSKDGALNLLYKIPKRQVPKSKQMTVIHIGKWVECNANIKTKMPSKYFKCLLFRAFISLKPMPLSIHDNDLNPSLDKLPLSGALCQREFVYYAMLSRHR